MTVHGRYDPEINLNDTYNLRSELMLRELS